MLANARDSETAWRLHRILIHAPVNVLLRRESDLLDTPNLPEEVITRINRREDLSGWPGAKLWQELQDFAKRSEDKRNVGEIDHAYANDLVEALGSCPPPTPDQKCWSGVGRRAGRRAAVGKHNTATMLVASAFVVARKALEELGDRPDG